MEFYSVNKKNTNTYNNMDKPQKTYTWIFKIMNTWIYNIFDMFQSVWLFFQCSNCPVFGE